MDGQTNGRMDGWMNMKVLINKMDGDKNTSMSCGGGEDAAKATEGLMMGHKTRSCLPSRGRDHKAGLGGERPRWCCPFTVGRKASVTKGKKVSLKTEPDTRTTTQDQRDVSWDWRSNICLQSNFFQEFKMFLWILKCGIIFSEFCCSIPKIPRTDSFWLWVVVLFWNTKSKLGVNLVCNNR